jgi:hypothetical protein
MDKVTKKRTTRGTIAALAVIGLTLGATAGACDSGDKKSGQKADTDTLSAVRKAAQTAVPYPLADVKRGGFLERRLLKENLLRQNDPKRLAYVTLLTDQGQIVATYPIQGMVFNLNSQMTTTQTTECHGSDCKSLAALDAVGDNGTFGDEPHSIAFFTTNGVEIKWSGTYLESDAPLDLKSKPLLTYNVNQSPSVNHGGVKTR